MGGDYAATGEAAPSALAGVEEISPYTFATHVLVRHRVCMDNVHSYSAG